MATLIDLVNLHESGYSEESLVIEKLVLGPLYEKGSFRSITEIINLSTADLKLLMIAEDDVVTRMATLIATKSALISGGSEQEKWDAFLNLFSDSFQKFVKIYVNYETLETIPATLFDTFKTRSVSEHKSVLVTLNIEPHDFWFSYASYAKHLANLLVDEWSAFEKTLESSFQKAVLDFDNFIQNGPVFLAGNTVFPYNENSPMLKDFLQVKEKTPVELAQYFIDRTDNTGYYMSVYGVMYQYIASQIKLKSEEVFNGFIEENKQEEAFFNLFEEEWKIGIKSFIDTLKSKGRITVFQDLRKIPSNTYCAIVQYTPSSHSGKQLVDIDPMKYESFYKTPFVVGDLFVIKINDIEVTYVATGTTLESITEGLTNAINLSEASDFVTARDKGYAVEVQAKTDNIPFTIETISLLTEITGYYYVILTEPPLAIPALSSDHPLWLSMAQAWLLAANSVDTDVSDVRTFRGKLYDKDTRGTQIPMANARVRVYDVDNEVQPIFLGITTTEADGSFMISYSVANEFVESKKLRVELLDEYDVPLKITSCQETNYFVDATGGTFEGGTAPDYPEWQLTLGTDIKIEPAVRLIENVFSSFAESIEGWYVRINATYPVKVAPLSQVFVGWIYISSYRTPWRYFTDQEFVIGKKYRIKFTVCINPPEFNPSFTLYFGTTQISVPVTDSFVVHEYDLVYDGPVEIEDYMKNYTQSFGLEGTEVVFGEVMVSEVEENILEGDFTPQFYLDSEEATDSFVWSSDTPVAVQENKQYEISAYVYFNDPVVAEKDFLSAGLYLSNGNSLSDFTSVEVVNGTNLLRYTQGIIVASQKNEAGTWRKITTKFIADTDGTVTVSLAMKGSSAFLGKFSICIDQVTMSLAASDYLDIIDTVTDQDMVCFYHEGQSTITSLEITEVLGNDISTYHKVNITPVNPEQGDVFILTLDNKSSVSWKAEDNTVEGVVAGLQESIVRDSGALEIDLVQSTSVSVPQITNVTPREVSTGVRYRISKRMRNIFSDGNNGTFETTTDPAGTPPDDWNLRPAFAELSQSSDSFYRGSKSLKIYLNGYFPKKDILLFESATPIPIKRNVRYKISAQIANADYSEHFDELAEFYFLPKGYHKKSVETIVTRVVTPVVSGYTEISTTFKALTDEGIVLQFFMEMKEALDDPEGEWYIDELRLEEVPEETPVVEYIALGDDPEDVVAGLVEAILEGSAYVNIATQKLAGNTSKQNVLVTPVNVQVGAVYTLELNGGASISYKALNATVADVTAGLAAAIQNSPDWDSVVVIDNTTNLSITAVYTNTVFVITQTGGQWYDVIVSDQTTHLRLTGRDNNMPFFIEQIGGGWSILDAYDEGFYLQLIGKEEDTPFEIKGKVVKHHRQDDTKNSLLLETLLEQYGIVLPPALVEVLIAKDIYTLDDIIALGGIKNNINGLLKIETIQEATTDQPQMIRLTPQQIKVGDRYVLQINGVDVISFVTEYGIQEDVQEGLLVLINEATGYWANVTATISAGDIIVIHNDNNVPFSIVQLMTVDTSVIQKLDALASLYTVTEGLDLVEEKTLLLLEGLIEAGYTDALAIAGVSQSEFVNTVNKIIGDFNAARMYELALARQSIIQEITSQYRAAQSSYKINKTARPTSEKLDAIIGEECYCDDCEAAVSPLAYLTDLMNYVVKNAWVHWEYPPRSNGNGREVKYISPNTPFTLEKLDMIFCQNFIELPSSCDDITNTVCQPRISIEVLRRYLAASTTSIPTANKNKLAVDSRAYMFKAYKYLLESIGTSYNEIRLVKREDDKKMLAEKLGFDYETNPEFLKKLFIEPSIIAMDSWEKYKQAMPGSIHPLMDIMIENFQTASIPFTFEDFVEADVDLVREKLTLQRSNFYELLASYIVEEVRMVHMDIEALNVPNVQKEEMKWNKWLYSITNKFPIEFREFFTLFESFRTNMSFLASPTNKNIVELILTESSLIKEGNRYWNVFASALKDKLEDYYLNEKDLEELFGLSDTRKDVFSDGAKLGDENNILTRWNIRGVSWGQNTDSEGYIYLEMDEVDGVIRVYKDRARQNPTDLVAVAILDNLTNKFIISEYKDSGLSGEFIVSELDGIAQIYISVLPLYLSWQFNALRTRWKREDAWNSSPVIDPDLIEPGDIKYPFDIQDGPPVSPIDLWQQRKTDIDNKRQEIQALREAAITPEYDLFEGTGRFGAPSSVVSDKEGNIYLVAQVQQQVKKMSADGSEIITLISGLNVPRSLIISADEKIILLENSRISQYSFEGILEWSFGSSGERLGQLHDAMDLALNSKNVLYVTDRASYGGNSGRVQAFTLPSDSIEYFPAAELAIHTIVENAPDVKQVNEVVPSKIRLGDLFRLTLQGVGSVEYTALSESPDDVVMGLYNAILVAGDWSSVQTVVKEGYLEFTSATAGVPFELFYESSVAYNTTGTIAADQSGYFYVADKDNSRILKLDAEHKVVKVFGNAHQYTKSLVAMYRLDESIGNTARDSAGKLVQHTATVTGTAEWSSLGKVRGSLVLNGTENALMIPSHTDLDASIIRNRALEIWFRADKQNWDQYQVLYRQGDDLTGFNAYLYQGKLYVGLYEGSAEVFLSAKQVQWDVWQHLVVVLEHRPIPGQPHLRVYLNGTLVASDNTLDSISPSALPDGIHMGGLINGKIRFHAQTVSSSTSDFYYKGGLDNIRIWNRALQKEEIDRLYGRMEDEGGTLFIPGYMKVDPSGNLYVIDIGTASFIKYSPDGSFILRYGNYGTGNLLFKDPIGLEVDPEENIYILDKENNYLQKINAQGLILYSVGAEGSGKEEFEAPTAIAADSTGYLYVSDTGNNRIQILEPQAGDFITQWTAWRNESGSTDFITPSALTVDQSDNIIVMSNGNTLVCIPNNNDSTAFVLPGVGSPWAFNNAGTISLGQDGSLYMALSGNRVRRFKFPYQITSVLLQKGVTISNPYFNNLNGVEVDPFDNIWLSDPGNYRVLKLTSEGYFLNQIGGAPGIVEGEFYSPSGITADESGNVYITDIGSNRVQKFDNSGTFIRLWNFNGVLASPIAVFIDQSRVGYIANIANSTILRWDSLHGIGALTAEVDLMDTSLAEVLSIRVREKQGDNIVESIEALHLDLTSYRYFLKIIDFAEQELELLDDQLEDLYDLFVQVYKRGIYSLWKKEEEALDITLSQDHFVLRDKNSNYEIELIALRGSKRARKNWVDTLQARIDQEKSLWEAHLEFMKEAEDQLYLELRDILVMATDFGVPGATLQEKAKIGSDRLLIDLKNNCCQRTTRVSQAFETLQGMMWGIRNGFIQDTYPKWYIDNAKFDEEWKWMGSYATWRAAQFVFMYPENLLLPSFVSNPTTHFKELISVFRNELSITPKSACDYAREYLDTIKDIGTIQVVSTLEMKIDLSLKEDCEPVQVRNQKLLFMVGVSEKGRYYWATYDNEQKDFYQFWDFLPGILEINALRIVGLIAHVNKKKERFLYLFFENLDGNPKALSWIRYNRSNNSWEEDVAKVDLKTLNATYTEILSPLVLDAQEDEKEKKHIVFEANGGANSAPNLGKRIFVVALDDDMQAVSAEWNHDNQLLNGTPLFSSDRRILWERKVNSSNANATVYFSRTNYDLSPRVISLNLSASYKVVGLVTMKISGTPFYYIFANRDNKSYYTLTTGGGSMMVKGWTPFMDQPLSYVGKIGNDKNTGLSLVYQYLTDNTNSSYKSLYVRDIKVGNDFSITFPVEKIQTVLSYDLSGLGSYKHLPSDVDYWRENNGRIYENNKSIVPSALRIINEYQYLVPMQVALSLQKRAFYQEALDWYRMLYDYSEENVSKREIYYGFRDERTSPYYIIDNFDNERMAIPSLRYSNVTKVANPSVSVGNQERMVGAIAASTISASITYALPGNHRIDLRNLAFEVDFFCLTGLVKIEIHIMQKRADASIQVGAVYSATSSLLNKWEPLVFRLDSVMPGYIPEDATAFELKFQRLNAPPTSYTYLYLSNFRTLRIKNIDKPVNWLQNPIDPHSIASIRENSYLRYTILSIAQCMVGYADSEYTQDTAESVPRARVLYEEALELLSDNGIRTVFDECAEQIEKVALLVETQVQQEPEWLPVWEGIKKELYHVQKRQVLETLLGDIKIILLEEGATIEEKLSLIRTELNLLLVHPDYFNNMYQTISTSGEVASDVYMQMNAEPALRTYITKQAGTLSKMYLDRIKGMTGVSSELLLSEQIFGDNTVLGQLHGTTQAVSSGAVSLVQITGSENDLDPLFVSAVSSGDEEALQLYLLNDLKKSLASVIDYRVHYMPSTNFNFCIPPNPIVTMLRMKAELNLFKIRNCRNIAGEVRELNPFAAPIDATTGIPMIGAGGSIQLPGTSIFRPTIHRYQTLVERAKNIVQLAQQLEASMLSTLEKLDSERYNMLKARQDLNLSKASIRLQDLRVKESQSNVKLAELQRERADLQVKELQEMIDAGLNEYEEKTIEAYEMLNILSNTMASIKALTDGARLGVGVAGSGMGAAAAAAVAIAGYVGIAFEAVYAGMVNAVNKDIQIFSIRSAFERRKQEWEYQKEIASHDSKIGKQQEKVANDHLAVVGQEREIAHLQSEHSQATIDFLNNKFTNVELYDWMSGVLEGVYASLLQQATSIAKLAQVQLAFERQELSPDFIKNDYWNAPTDNFLESGIGNEKSVDRKGLTGSTRLLQDLVLLDQYAFTADRRKMELTRTFSLASMFPSELQIFKETGELIFEIPMSVFDRDFPGHYLRLIKKVSTSVIALIPPTDSIKATLASTGITYVVTGGDVFQKSPVIRSSESVALSAATNATGMFELNPMNNEKLNPFEGTGVEGSWIFSMPKASNFFDYTTIADILFTIEYTAFSDDAYRMQVIEELDVDVNAERAFSFRNQFADQWYDLNNSEQTSTPMKVQFSVSRQDFPANIRELKIAQLMMYFVKSDTLDLLDPNDEAYSEQIGKMPVPLLRYTPKGSKTPRDARGASAREGIISTRKMSGASWATFIGTTVEGTWELELKEEHKVLFKEKKITDILFVITYKGESHEWPK